MLTNLYLSFRERSVHQKRRNVGGQTLKLGRAVARTTEKLFPRCAMSVSCPECVGKSTKVSLNNNNRASASLSVATAERRFLVSRRGRGHMTRGKEVGENIFPLYKIKV
ncbi:Hypothetical protein SMAX5B_016475 [Scophthalmus maximus]|uniref:Uncharacterized protein n=1 Tax=Scophthalmus maximus TaxID=52904 RepID=A0A2U9BSQ6_SCOMX|nr:Hypothetical protein SMAX5B_016475 [Scophthalmus maximus]KAF0033920.1 hypothetical protein F2P81_013986 [Scophthalmus maximus]